jgi:MoxR-like ATPase
MKKSLAVKSLSAGLGALILAGPAAAQELAASPLRASLGGLSASAPVIVASPTAPPSAAAPGFTMPLPLSATLIPSAAPVAAPAAASAATPVSASPEVSAAPATPGFTALVRDFFSSPRSADTAAANGAAAAKADGDARFDGARALMTPLVSFSAPAHEEPPRALALAPAASASTRFSQGATPELAEQVSAKFELVRRLRAEIGKVIVGQQEMVDSIIMSLIASEHVLLEGVPGVAKTQAVKAAADAVSGDFKRIQGTPDKLPSDIIGAEILQDDPERPGVKVIQVQFGPVFTNILLVDEINRMMPKTQSALLEAMAESQVTIGNKTYKLSKPFLVIATQNPIEQEGTYRLPEAQQDRFMLKTTVPLPSTSELLEIMERFSSKDNQPKAEKVHSLEELDEIRRVADKIYVAPALKAYIADIVEATSHAEKYGISLPANAIEKEGGAGPRAGIYLLKAARVHALMEGRAWVGPDDIAAVAHRVLRHRITLGFAAPRELTTDKVVDAILARVPVPAR